MRQLLLLAAVSVALLPAQDLYPFGIDQDSVTFPDYSYLNHSLTADDRISVRDGHFYNAVGERVRFFGVNLAFSANFPVKQDAVRIAQRLRRLGVNLVRLHHMDSSPDSVASNSNSILTTGPYPTFNEVSVQRLRDFLDALKAEGIYVNLNLHVGYQFRPTVDGVPVASIPTQSKPLHIFYPRMVELQKRYTEQILEKLGLQDNPVLAMVEVNNESSMLHEWQIGQLDPYLNGEYKSELQAQWNRWLGSKYGTSDELRNAWGAGSTDGPNLLPDRWTLEQGHGKVGTLSMVETDGIATAKVSPGQGSGWLFLKQTGFKMESGLRYLLKFEARADASGSVNVPVAVMRDVSPWDGLLYTSINVTNEWKSYIIGVPASFAIQDSGRVSLDVQYSPGPLYARNMSLVLAGQRGLAEGESLEAANISLLGPGEGATQARLDDYTQFLINTDRTYVNTIRDAVKAIVDVPVTGTQMGYGGLAVLDSQDGMDYQDNHFYIDHYNFPNVQWDGFDWRIRDSAMSGNGWNDLINMAWARESGKPYTVSEFNEPWPNTHGAEIIPTLAAFGAMQDWDGLMHFAYSHGRGWDDGVPNGFNLNGDWTKWPSFGQAAWIFRTAAVPPSSKRTVLGASESQRLRAAQLGQSASTFAGRSTRALLQAVAVSRSEDISEDPVDTGLKFDGKVFTLNSPMAVGAFGAKPKTTVGPVDFDVQSNFAAILITPTDGARIEDSADLLITMPGASYRSIPGTTQPQLLKLYPGTTDWWTIDNAATNRPSGNLNGGSRPTYMERVDAYITIHTRANSAVVQPEVEVEPVDGGFRLHLNAASPWYRVQFVR